MAFISRLRGFYPVAGMVCLSSPLANPALATFMKKALTTVVNRLNNRGDNKVYAFFFSKQYHKGCDGHPDLAEHRLIAEELTAFIKSIIAW